jgi:hypothetical protein
MWAGAIGPAPFVIFVKQFNTKGGKIQWQPIENVCAVAQDILTVLTVQAATE